MKCPLVRPTIVRAINEQVPTECYAHQLRILAQMHGEDNVEIDADVPPILYRNLLAHEEWSRLEKLYGNVPEERYSWCERVWGALSSGRLQADMKLGMGVVQQMNEVYVDDLSAEQEEDTVTEGPPIGGYPWMKQQLQMLGIEFSGNAKKADLDALLRATYCEQLELEWEEVATMPFEQLHDQWEAAAANESREEAA